MFRNKSSSTDVLLKMRWGVQFKVVEILPFSPRQKSKQKLSKNEQRNLSTTLRLMFQEENEAFGDNGRAKCCFKLDFIY